MKKTVLIALLAIASVAQSLELKIYQCSLGSATQPGDLAFIDLDLYDRTRTGYEVVDVYIYHRNADMTFSDTVILASVFITDMVKNDFPQDNGYKRIWFNMVTDYPYGAYFIKVTYCKDVIGQFWRHQVTSIEDTFLDNNEPVHYYNLSGQEIPEPKGICIEQKGSVRRKIVRGE